MELFYCSTILSLWLVSSQVAFSFLADIYTCLILFARNKWLADCITELELTHIPNDLHQSAAPGYTCVVLNILVTLIKISDGSSYSQTASLVMFLKQSCFISPPFPCRKIEYLLSRINASSDHYKHPLRRSCIVIVWNNSVIFLEFFFLSFTVA